MRQQVDIIKEQQKPQVISADQAENVLCNKRGNAAGGIGPVHQFRTAGCDAASESSNSDERNPESGSDSEAGAVDLADTSRERQSVQQTADAAPEQIFGSRYTTTLHVVAVHAHCQQTVSVCHYVVCLQCQHDPTS